MTWLIPLSSAVCVQAREFAESAGRTTRSGYEVAPISAAALAELAPGMCPNALAAAAEGDSRGAGLLVQGGLVLHPERYVRCDSRCTTLVSWAWRVGLPVAPGMCSKALAAALIVGEGAAQVVTRLAPG